VQDYNSVPTETRPHYFFHACRLKEFFTVDIGPLTYGEHKIMVDAGYQRNYSSTERKQDIQKTLNHSARLVQKSETCIESIQGQVGKHK
jgi:hypothetical protein